MSLSTSPAPGRIAALRRELLAHYDAMCRELPWRGETDAYRIWVSEVMLQQTRVETVIPYYRRWLALFPDVATLADADVDDVLLAWQGLGYYRRARGLHSGARVVRDRHAGVVPRTMAELRALPGVGEYTAGAVASIAYGDAVPAVDGNVRRVFARLFDVASPGPAWLRSTAAALVDPSRPGDWNQALMDLGATVCVPRGPRCHSCPLTGWCDAFAAGTQAERPARAPAKEVPAVTFATAVVVDGRGYGLVVRRPEDGLLGGMWAFPDVTLEAGGSGEREEEVSREAGGRRVREEDVVRAALSAARGAGADVGPVGVVGPLDPDPGAASHGPDANPATLNHDQAATSLGADSRAAPPDPPPRLLPRVRHRFTHLAACYRPVLLAGDCAEDENRRWVPLAGPWPVALPVAQQKIAEAAGAAMEAAQAVVEKAQPVVEDPEIPEP